MQRASVEGQQAALLAESGQMVVQAEVEHALRAKVGCCGCLWTVRSTLVSDCHKGQRFSSVRLPRGDSLWQVVKKWPGATIPPGYLSLPLLSTYHQPPAISMGSC